jgi:hypothetical protein
VVVLRFWTQAGRGEWAGGLRAALKWFIAVLVCMAGLGKTVFWAGNFVGKRFVCIGLEIF